VIAQSILGIVVLTALAWAIGEGRRAPPWKVIAAGLAVQLGLAVVLLKVGFIKQAFLGLNAAVLALQEATRAGTGFVFGYLGGGALPFTESYPGASFVLAFQALPLILVMSALSALLFHWRVLPAIVKAFAWALRKTLGVGGPVGVAAAANIFIGMVEAPLMVRPYLRALSRSELFIVMTCGMATIAGTVMVLYATILAQVVPDAVGHILTASLISAPAAIMVARLMVPESGTATESAGAGTTVLEASDADSAMDAITKGTTAGVGLLINVIALLVVLVALVSLINLALGAFPDIAGAPLTLQRFLGWIMAPVVWLIGVPWGEATTAGALMGTKTILNEFIAYIDLSRLPAEALSDRSRLIMTYALCGFANFGSLGIMIGGMGTMVPERRGEIVGLGLKSIVSGTLATCLTAAVVGVII
jgi:concentrative nucleoside transporter, CNT family